MPKRLFLLLLAGIAVAFAQTAPAPSLPLIYFLGRDGVTSRVGPSESLIAPKAVAAGPGGDIWVAGEAVGNTLPAVNAFRGENPPGLSCGHFRGCSDAFLTRLRADGQGARFSTYLGGDDSETLAGMALDDQGNAYLTGQTHSTSFSFDHELTEEQFFGYRNFVAKFSPTGDLIYATALPLATIPAAIVAGRQGSVYIAGVATGEVETVGGLGFGPDQAQLLRSDDSGETWAFRNEGLPPGASDLIAAGRTENVRLYAGPYFGSADRGESWQRTNADWRVDYPLSQDLAVDPAQPDRLFAAHNCELSASSDGGDTWSLLTADEFQGGCVTNVAIAPSRPATVYVGGSRGPLGLEGWMARSEDGGQTWSPVSMPQGETISGVEDLAVDPMDPSILYAVFYGAGERRLFRTDNAGQSWRLIFEHTRRTPVFDPAEPTSLYMVLGTSEDTGRLVYLSFDRGETWSSSQLPEQPQESSGWPRDIAFSSEALFVTTDKGRLFRSTDRGLSWLQAPGPPVPVYEVEADPAQPSTIYALGASLAEQGFLLKLSPDGSRIDYLTLLGGNGRDHIAGLAIGDDGRIYATGITSAPDFPVTAQLGSNQPGFQTDAFLAIISPQGDVLEYSTLIGGAADEELPRIALGADGNVLLAGSTRSRDFPSETPFVAQTLNIRSLWVVAVAPEQNRFAFTGYVDQSQSTASGPIALAAGQDGAVYLAGRRTILDSEAVSLDNSFLMRLDAEGNVTNLDPIAAEALAMRSPGVVIGAATAVSGIPTPLSIAGHKHAASVSVIDYTTGQTEGPRVYAIVNAADQRGHPATPGAVVTIYGTNLGPSQASGGQPVDGRFPTELAGVRVLFGDQPAPLLYVSQGQINAVTPFELGDHPLAPVRVERDGNSSNVFTLTTHTASPGIFLAGPGPTITPVAINEDGTLNSPDNPVPPGAAVTIFATGAGAFSPPLADGEVAPLEPPFPSTPRIAAVEVEAQFNLLLETRGARITYAGVTPGVVAGVAQINFVVPRDTPPGDCFVNLRTDQGDLSGQVVLAVGP